MTGNPIPPIDLYDTSQDAAFQGQTTMLELCNGRFIIQTTPGSNDPEIGIRENGRLIVKPYSQWTLAELKPLLDALVYRASLFQSAIANQKP